MKIVGVSGKDRSGKDTVAELFIEAGYFGFSFGDAARRHTRKRHAGKPDVIAVENITETSNYLRNKLGPDYLLKEALEAFERATKEGKKYNGIVLYSLRAPVEVDFVLDKGGEIIWIESSDEVRLQRKLANMRDGEQPVSMAEMLNQESLQFKKQENLPPEAQMDLNYVKSKATIIIENNGDNREAFIREAKTRLGLE